MRLLRRKTQSGEPQPFAPQLFLVLIDAALFCRCQFSLGILDPEPSKQQLSALVCARHLANRRVLDRSAHDHLQERQSKLADLSLEAYQELLDANDNHPSLEQVDEAIAKVLEADPELARQEKEEQEHHLMSRQSKLGDIDLERYQDLMDESHGHPTLEQVEAAIAAAVAEDPERQAILDASSDEAESDEG